MHHQEDHQVLCTEAMTQAREFQDRQDAGDGGEMRTSPGKLTVSDPHGALAIW